MQDIFFNAARFSDKATMMDGVHIRPVLIHTLVPGWTLNAL